VFALVSSFIQIRVDGWRLCQASRRPQPKIAGNIGVWEDVLGIIGNLAVLCNMGLIFLTGGYLKNYTWYQRCVMFVAAEHFGFAIKYLISYFIPAISRDVTIQLAR
jgi:anoctamin-8